MRPLTMKTQLRKPSGRLPLLGRRSLKCLEMGELEERLAMLEATVRSRDLSPAPAFASTSAFDMDLDLDPDVDEDMRPKELNP